MQREQARQLVDGPLVVVDAEVDDDVAAAVAATLRDDEERGGLLPSPVAARSLAGGERR